MREPLFPHPVSFGLPLSAIALLRRSGAKLASNLQSMFDLLAKLSVACMLEAVLVY